MYRNIQTFIALIQNIKRLKTKRKELLYLIQVRRVFEWISIDLVKSLPITTQNNWYIIVTTDYLTK